MHRFFSKTVLFVFFLLTHLMCATSWLVSILPCANLLPVPKKSCQLSIFSICWKLWYFVRRAAQRISLCWCSSFPLLEIQQAQRGLNWIGCFWPTMLFIDIWCKCDSFTTSVCGTIIISNSFYHVQFCFQVNHLTYWLIITPPCSMRLRRMQEGWVWCERCNSDQQNSTNGRRDTLI